MSHFSGLAVLTVYMLSKSTATDMFSTFLEGYIGFIMIFAVTIFTTCGTMETLFAEVQNW